MSHPIRYPVELFKNSYNLRDNFTAELIMSTSPLVDIKMHHIVSYPTLAEDFVADGVSRVLVFSAGHGFSVGEDVVLREDTHFMEATVQVVDGNNITIDTPPLFNYTTAASIERATTNMAVDGSVTPVVFQVNPPLGVKFHITRVIFFIQDSTAVAMDDGKFGNIAALTNGCVLRRYDGLETSFNVFNYKSNGDLKQRNYDGDYSDKAPAGSYSFTSRRSFSGQDKNGAAIMLDGDKDESLQVLIQDDLTALDIVSVIAQGHISEH